MKKCDFYTRQKPGLVLVRGYTDGTFNYYKHDIYRVWYAIDASTGLSICAGLTRASTQQYAWEHMDDYNKFLKTKKYIVAQQAFKEMIEEYERNK